MDIAKTLTFLTLEANSPLPLYQQLANHLASRIETGALPSGTRLPPERELAKWLSVSRTTIINAYKTLEDRGLASSRIGSGTYAMLARSEAEAAGTLPWEQLFTPRPDAPLSTTLRNLIDNPTAGQVISLAAGMPDPDYYPPSIFSPLFDATDAAANAHYGHLATEGFGPLRQSLAKQLSEQGLHAKPENILITTGSQQGLYLAAKAFLEPQDTVIVETPGYFGGTQIFESLGARVLSLPMGESLNLALLEDHLIRYRPKLFYTVPNYQNPTGRLMPLHERHEILRLAAAHRLIIIEDDPYGQLYYGAAPPPPLKALDPFGGVIYLGTVSKLLCPGLRLGWLVAPAPVINRLAQEKQYIDLHTSNLSQLSFHRFLTEGRLAEHGTNMRNLYHKRRDALGSALRRYCAPYLDFQPVSGGFYYWCTLKAPASTDKLLHHAATQGVTFVPGQAFYPTRHLTDRQELRLCFATHNEEKLTEGARILGRILSAGLANSEACEAVGRPIR